MRLIEWLSLPNPDGSRKRRYKFARRIKVTPTMVTEYAEGRMWPGRDKFESIVRETRGVVTANDFLSPEARKIIEAAAVMQTIVEAAE